jgi:hypothetical protein
VISRTKISSGIKLDPTNQPPPIKEYLSQRIILVESAPGGKISIESFIANAIHIILKTRLVESI